MERRVAWHAALADTARLRIVDLLALGDGTGSFDITFGITKDGELRRAVTTGPFFTGSTSTYTLLLTDYGKAVTITAPM